MPRHNWWERQQSLAEWFAERTIPEPNTGCVFWLGAFGNGYGIIVQQRDGIRTKVRAHQLAWVLKNGPIPEGMHVLHRCDTSLCVNADHLFLGTNADNVADRVKKGRTRVRARVDRPYRRPAHRNRCKAGHVFDDDTEYVMPSGRRQCRKCKARRQHEYSQRRRERAA